MRRGQGSVSLALWLIRRQASLSLSLFFCLTFYSATRVLIGALSGGRLCESQASELVARGGDDEGEQRRTARACTGTLFSCELHEPSMRAHWCSCPPGPCHAYNLWAAGDRRERTTRHERRRRCTQPILERKLPLCPLSRTRARTSAHAVQRREGREQWAHRNSQRTHVQGPQGCRGDHAPPRCSLSELCTAARTVQKRTTTVTC